MTSSPSSKKSTEPPQQLLTLPSCVGTFLLENWNVCGLELSRNLPLLSIRRDVASPTIALGLHFLCQDELADGRSFWSSTCEVIGSHTFNFTTRLLEIGSTLSLVSFQNSSFPPQHHHHHHHRYHHHPFLSWCETMVI